LPLRRSHGALARRGDPHLIAGKEIETLETDMITVIAINAVLAAIVLVAVLALLVRAIRPARTVPAGALARIVTFNASSTRERRKLADAA
jgi:hypothetical protein